MANAATGGTINIMIPVSFGLMTNIIEEPTVAVAKALINKDKLAFLSAYFLYFYLKPSLTLFVKLLPTIAVSVDNRDINSPVRFLSKNDMSCFKTDLYKSLRSF